MTAQPEGVRRNQQSGGFQAKASEKCSSAARNPEPGASSRCNRERKTPKKAGVKAERSSKLLDDVKGDVACRVDAGGEGWQGKGAGERVKDAQSLAVDATLLPREI